MDAVIFLLGFTQSCLHNIRCNSVQVALFSGIIGRYFKIEKKLKKPWHGTKNLRKGAKTRVRLFADTQNFALCAYCVLGNPTGRKGTTDTNMCGPKKGPMAPHGCMCALVVTK